MAISVRLGIGRINQVRSVGVRGFHGRGNRREGGRGSGGNAARGRDVAALAVAMETERRSWTRGNRLIDWPSVVDRVRYHWALSIA